MKQKRSTKRCKSAAQETQTSNLFEMQENFWMRVKKPNKSLPLE